MLIRERYHCLVDNAKGFEKEKTRAFAGGRRPEKVARTRRKYECSADGCTNIAEWKYASASGRRSNANQILQISLLLDVPKWDIKE